MNKTDLTEAVAAELGQSKSAAGRAVEAVLSGIVEGVRRDGSVTIVGFGTFELRNRAGRTGRNPITKEPIQIPPSRTLGFRPATALKKSL